MRAFAIVVAAGVSGLCACTEFTVSSEFLATMPSRPAVDPAHVELVFGGHAARPYQESGVVSTVGTRWLGSGPGKRVASLGLGDLVGELRGIAAAHGCDALLVNPETLGRASVMLSATCIVYAPAAAAN